MTKYCAPGSPHYMGKSAAPPTVMGVMRKRSHNLGSKIIHVQNLKYVIYGLYLSTLNQGLSVVEFNMDICFTEDV